MRINVSEHRLLTHGYLTEAALRRDAGLRVVASTGQMITVWFLPLDFTELILKRRRRAEEQEVTEDIRQLSGRPEHHVIEYVGYVGLLHPSAVKLRLLALGYINVV